MTATWPPRPRPGGSTVSAEHVVVIGAGIVGLATAHELTTRGYGVTVLDKEQRGGRPPDRPQLRGHPLGPLLRAGQPQGRGSVSRVPRLDARASPASTVSTSRWAASSWWPPHERQLPALRELVRRGAANGVPCREIGPAEAREFEPHVSCVAALRVETTGIIDYRGVSERLARAGRRRGRRRTARHHRRGHRHHGDRGHGRDRPGTDPGRPAGQLRRAAERPDRPAGRARPGRADHPVPRRVLRADGPVLAPGAGADLPGARTRRCRSSACT